MEVIWFLLGFFIGGFCGVMVMALVSANSHFEEDESIEQDEECSDWSV